jgi:AcrR family transcriptional regulator
MGEGSTRSPMRERFREQVRDDVKVAALVQLADGGPAAVSVNGIAKGLGVSGPALYRYFAGRDELLAELVADTYRDLAGALGASVDPALGLATVERVRALCAAWRDFARAEPHRYRLLFAPPLPGHDAHAEPLVAASRDVMAVARDVVAPLAPAPDDLTAVLSLWTRLHGFAGLELGGNFISMGLDPDALFRREVDDLVRDLYRAEG